MQLKAGSGVDFFQDKAFFCAPDGQPQLSCFKHTAFSGFQSCSVDYNGTGLILSVTTTGPETQLPSPVAHAQAPHGCKCYRLPSTYPFNSDVFSDVLAKTNKLKDNIALSSTSRSTTTFNL